MTNRNFTRFSALVMIAALTLFGASTSARSSYQKAGQQPDLSLMGKNDPIPGVDIIIKKKPGGNGGSNTKTGKDGWFTFDNLPFGTYNLTFAAPKLSPALAGKVEYLVIIEQSEVGNANSSTAKTQSDSKTNTARIATAKIAEGFDFSVGAEPQEGGINTSKSNVKNTPLKQNDQAKHVKDWEGKQRTIVRGKIFLVEIGTTNIVVDQPVVKATKQ